jgi:hypothetical protein
VHYSLVNSATFTILYCGQNFNIRLTKTSLLLWQFFLLVPRDISFLVSIHAYAEVILLRTPLHTFLVTIQES